jgi:hypothetical protein
MMPPMRYSETVSNFDSRCFGVGISDTAHLLPGFLGAKGLGSHRDFFSAHPEGLYL